MKQKITTDRDVRKFIESLQQKGWKIIRRCGSGHIKMAAPNGMTTIFPNTPSDGRWIKNKRAEVKRIERQMHEKNTTDNHQNENEKFAGKNAL